MPEIEIPAPFVEPDRVTVFDQYGNALSARWLSDGVQIGGVFITDRDVADMLARFITREDESA